MVSIKRIGTFTIDELGRVCISSELRSMLEWQVGDQLDVHYVDSKTAILQLADEPNSQICDLCGVGVGLIEVKGHEICRECAGKVVELCRLRITFGD